TQLHGIGAHGFTVTGLPNDLRELELIEAGRLAVTVARFDAAQIPSLVFECREEFLDEILIGRSFEFVTLFFLNEASDESSVTALWADATGFATAVSCERFGPNGSGRRDVVLILIPPGCAKTFAEVGRVFLDFRFRQIRLAVKREFMAEEVERHTNHRAAVGDA